MAYQMYRNTTLGDALQKTLDELIQDGVIGPQLALRVMLTFDKAINKALSTRVKTRVQFRADHLKTYRFCDNVWTFVMEDVDFRDLVDQRRIERVKFVACDGKTNPAAATASGTSGTVSNT